MIENMIYVQDNSLVLITPKNESTLVMTKKQVCDACKKQIPKKPLEIKLSSCYEMSEHNIKEAKCPSCGEKVIGNQFGYYCGSCGQALDWSDT